MKMYNVYLQEDLQGRAEGSSFGVACRRVIEANSELDEEFYSKKLNSYNGVVFTEDAVAVVSTTEDSATTTIIEKDFSEEVIEQVEEELDAAPIPKAKKKVVAKASQPKQTKDGVERNYIPRSPRYG